MKMEFWQYLDAKHHDGAKWLPRLLGQKACDRFDELLKKQYGPPRDWLSLKWELERGYEDE